MHLEGDGSALFATFAHNPPKPFRETSALQTLSYGELFTLKFHLLLDPLGRGSMEVLVPCYSPLVPWRTSLAKLWPGILHKGKYDGLNLSP